jgi:hypothetical protein
MIAGGAAHIYFLNYFLSFTYMAYKSSETWYFMLYSISCIASIVCLGICFKESYTTFKTLFGTSEGTKTKLRINLLRGKYGKSYGILKE